MRPKANSKKFGNANPKLSKYGFVLANTASYLQMRLRTCKCGFFAANAASLQQIRNNIFLFGHAKRFQSLYILCTSAKKSAGPGQMRLWLAIDFHWLVVCKCSCCVSQVQRPYLLRWAQNPARKKYQTTQHNTTQHNTTQHNTR